MATTCNQILADYTFLSGRKGEVEFSETTDGDIVITVKKADGNRVEKISAQKKKNLLEEFCVKAKKWKNKKNTQDLAKRLMSDSNFHKRLMAKLWGNCDIGVYSTLGTMGIMLAERMVMNAEKQIYGTTTLRSTPLAHTSNAVMTVGIMAMVDGCLGKERGRNDSLNLIGAIVAGAGANWYSEIYADTKINKSGTVDVEDLRAGLYAAMVYSLVGHPMLRMRSDPFAVVCN